MRLLVFSAYYKPEVAASLYLPENVYECFAGHGWDVILFTPVPTRGVSKEISKKYKTLNPEKKYGGRLEVHRVSMFGEKRNPVFRAFRYLLLNLSYLWKGLTASADAVFVQSTPPILGVVAAIIKKFKKIPFIYNLQDVFPDSMVISGFTKENSLLWKLGRSVENFTYKNADKVIVISEDIKSNILRKNVPEGKIEIVYNWVEESAVIPIKRAENGLFDELELDRGLFYAVYAGNLGNAQNIDVIVRASEKLKNIPDIRMIIIGEGMQKDIYMRMAKELSLDNLMFFPMQPYEKISQVYSMGDCSIVSCKPGVGASGLPSKTWSALSAGTPVIASFDDRTDLKRIIEKNRLGLFTSAGDSDALADAILTLYKNPDMRREMGQNGRMFVLNNLTKSIGSEKYFEIIRACL